MTRPLGFEAFTALAGHFIDGRFETNGLPIEVLCPSDGQPLGHVHEADAEIVDRAVNAAARAQVEWGDRPTRERGRVLRKFADLIEAKADELALLESTSSTRIFAQTSTYDAFATADIIRYYAEWADKLEGEVTSTANGTFSLVINEPYGVVGAIIPWNFPAINAAQKLGPILAAGNAIVIKPSELTPFSLLWLARLSLEAGVPAGIINVVNGTGAVTGAAIVEHPGIAKVTFVGSTATGAKIMGGAAASGVKPLTLELGGKSPFTVFADAPDLDHVADCLAIAFTFNSGQLCVAGSRLVVDRAIKDDLLARLDTRLDALKTGSAWRPETTLGPIISSLQADRITTLIDRTIADGATLRRGGKHAATENAGAFIEPTILDDVTEDMSGFRDEFFGPVLCVQTFDGSEEEAFSLAAHPTYGLAASVFTGSQSRALRYARTVEAGTIWTNTHGRGDDLTAPSGGFKGSGFGKDWGWHAMAEYLRKKTVVLTS